METLFTCPEAATAIGCSVSFIQKLISKNAVPYKAVANVRLLDAAGVETIRALWLERRKKRPGRLQLSEPTEEGDTPLSAEERKQLARLRKADKSRREKRERRDLIKRFQRRDLTLAELKALNKVRCERVELRDLRERYPEVE